MMAELWSAVVIWNVGCHGLLHFQVRGISIGCLESLSILQSAQVECLFKHRLNANHGDFGAHHNRLSWLVFSYSVSFSFVTDERGWSGMFSSLTVPAKAA